VLILKRSREAITDCDVEIDAERADTNPKVFTSIKLHFIVTGNNLDPRKVERAVKLSHEKYCSASAMLAASATMSYDFEIREASVATT
jgi:putative redox protein